jgi:calcium/calmodulin-dependent protein kinase kinase 2
MKAVRKFKNKVERKRRPHALQGTLDRGKRAFHQHPDLDGQQQPPLQKSKSDDTYDRRNVESILTAEGIRHDHSAGPFPRPLKPTNALVDSPKEESPRHTETFEIPPTDATFVVKQPTLRSESPGDKGHAQDPLEEPPLFLGIGTGAQTLDSLDTLEPPEQGGVAESPSAAEFSIYDTAYQQEVDRIREAQGHSAKVYLTRRVDRKLRYQADENMVDAPEASAVEGGAREGFKGLLDKAREKGELYHEKKKERERNDPEVMEKEKHRFGDIASRAMANTKSLGMNLRDRSGDKLDGGMQRAVERRWNVVDDKGS